MISRLTGWIFKLHGFKIVGDPLPPEANKCMMVFAPHTSNWDFYYGVIGITSWGLSVRYVIKDFWTKFPFGLLIKPLGGIGVSRDVKRDKEHIVSELADVFKTTDKITFVITPEGARAKRTIWRTGFYHIAKTADVPIVTMKADFKAREVTFGPILTGDMPLEEVMIEIAKFYKGSVAINPDKFAVDERYDIH